ncbi:biotin--[acetyl-CoA-carboxylase] ligase [Synechococcus sp. MW101C3]|jgi:BirA family biotin operon repressor/biotin-[acetyl-CoA-carboxylase] ligase|uniref:biotin--[acetyl-CoA-carboxylase] ligase n=1 Tax=Synechococcus sp. MW101C3 TaxID=210768 RepID=UPI000B99A8D1|nr:biotin--[acetyl-CoA-carboxylase] ligase [Synechococcus sp. MW101C3]
MIGRIAAARRELQLREGYLAPPLPWRLAMVPVCGSTERLLDQRKAGWGSGPLALLAQRQRFGHGQQGRPWVSPHGGVWLSAALPWPPQGASLAMAAAVGLALQLEALGLAPTLKWPNDLLLHNCKVAGLLPRLRLRGGRIQAARVGIGLNGENPVPAGAINVRQALALSGQARRQGADAIRLAARVLLALDWAVAAAVEPERVWQEADRRLHGRGQPLLWQGETWMVAGLARDGGLELRRGAECTIVRRRFAELSPQVA